jgi:hypothetical protein
MVTVAVDEIRELTPAERIERLHAVDAELRRLEAEAAVLVAAVGDDGAFRSRGHLTIAGFLRGELRWSQQQVTTRRQLARLVEQVPTVVEHLAARAIGVAKPAFGRSGANRAAVTSSPIMPVVVEHARIDVSAVR